MPAITEAALLERIIEPAHGTLTPDVARYLLTLAFRPEDQQRLEDLATKERAGSLTPAEQADLASFRRVSELLAVWQARARQVLAGAPVTSPTEEEPTFEIPPGIRRSQEAFWRDLPQLLAQKKLRGKWVCYHGDERIGIGRYEDLIRECLRRGLRDEEYDLGVIEPHALPPWEPEEIEPLDPEVDAVEIDDQTGNTAKPA
jgi:hypothetical protein